MEGVLENFHKVGIAAQATVWDPAYTIQSSHWTYGSRGSNGNCVEIQYVPAIKLLMMPKGKI